MEYYAKSQSLVLWEHAKERILEKLEEVIDHLDEETEGEDLRLLHSYRENLSQNRPADSQKTLQEHLEETVRCAENFFQLYGQYFSEKEKKLIIAACRLHDVGKANYIFQTKVNGTLKKERTEQIPHGFLSAVLLSQKAFLSQDPQYTKEDFEVLLTAVYYHHNRKDHYDDKEIREYCEKYYLNCVREYVSTGGTNLRPFLPPFSDRPNGDEDGSRMIHISNRNHLLFSDRKDKAIKSINEDMWCNYMLVKGMLNKFDWAVSAGYEIAEKFPDLAEKKLCKSIEKELSAKFRPAQEFMIQNRENNVVMIAPTGSGKTEAALMWLGGEKGFYTLPLKVSSDAIYHRIKERYGFKDAALLHSDSLTGYLKESEGDLESGYRQYEQAALFSNPLTVCTVDQLFKFVYKVLGTEIFAATLKYSKIVIDEIQSYSPKIVAALIYGLSEIKRMGGKFAIITATFPPVLKYFMEKYKLLENRDYVWHDFSGSALKIRHKVQWIEGDFEFEKIVKAAGEKKALVICNTVSKAQSVYMELMDRNIEAGLLHSRFIRKHREALEKNIMDFSADEKATGVWVTTQIVEASLDIDFDILYTEMCTADSLLQRMGRCNRAGRKAAEAPNVIVFHNGSGRGTVYDRELYDRSADLLKKYVGKLFSESDKTAYINEVYDIAQIRKTKYFKQIEESMEHFGELLPADYSALEAQKDFRDIQSITVMPDTIYNENYEIIQSIKELLEQPYVEKSVRKLLKSKLAEMTLSLNIYYGVPDGIDRNTIEFFDIHRTRLTYDFNGNTGAGLLLDQEEDEAYFV